MKQVFILFSMLLFSPAISAQTMDDLFDEDDLQSSLPAADSPKAKSAPAPVSVPQSVPKAAAVPSKPVVRTAERDRILHACMGDMNPDYREALYLTYFEGMSYAQAAEVMGKSVKQITNLVYRGKESLRKLLEREGVTDAES